jgi:hypothetical protein
MEVHNWEIIDKNEAFSSKLMFDIASSATGNPYQQTSIWKGMIQGQHEMRRKNT